MTLSIKDNFNFYRKKGKLWSFFVYFGLDSVSLDKWYIKHKAVPVTDVRCLPFHTDHCLRIIETALAVFLQPILAFRILDKLYKSIHGWANRRWMAQCVMGRRWDAVTDVNVLPTIPPLCHIVPPLYHIVNFILYIVTYFFMTSGVVSR